ncbi:SEC-C metal-binding domain-containing protein [Candidatus Methylomirabilis sp.]|uniref:SEC-C metal-binding domain-containing protein n=1 Tax=Candidatus Methylomirabilis sp. TaxID=2032687 RepID=UPI003075FF37
MLSADYSRAKRILCDWLYAFFEFMGRGFFALLLYWGSLAVFWGMPDELRDGQAVGRNDPCPCGSGAKYKRCCGA